MQPLIFELKAKARAEGFNAVGIASARLPASVGDDLSRFVDQGRHGTMQWLAQTQIRRGSPEAMWPQARSAIVLGLNYAQGLDNFARLEAKSTGVISVYALNRDYHDVIKGKLKRLASWFAKRTGADVKVFVDTAPLMEKPLAQQAGLGWQGKHTNLVSREWGSWFFLGVVLTDAELPPDAPQADHCGSCNACLDICPTKAITAPYEIDARRCISYLTIEHKDAIPLEFRKAIGNRIYGCDDCLAVCPWNSFAQQSREAKFAARTDLVAPKLADLLALDDQAFRAKFAGSPVKRIGHQRFIRNCLIAAGNAQDHSLIPAVSHLASHASPVVAETAGWALGELCP